MTPEQLREKLGGEASLNRMKAWVEGKLEIIAKMDKTGEYRLTDVGKAQAAKFNAQSTVGVDSEEIKPKRRARKSKVVETSPVEVSPSDEL